MPKPDDYFTNAIKYMFVVHLTRLIGGDGECSTSTKLNIPFNTPFHLFERIVQDETQLCLIAPGDDQATTSSSQTAFDHSASDLGVSASRATDRTDIATSTSTLAANTYTAYGRKWETYEERGTTWAKSFLPLNRKEKGYTIKDGPWVCAIKSRKASRGKIDKWHELFDVGDEASYRAMVLKVQSLNEKEPDNEYVVLIQHVSFSSSSYSIQMLRLTSCSRRKDGSLMRQRSKKSSFRMMPEHRGEV